MESAALDGVYASDEFRMFVHKVLPCSKRLAHDWASCPFSHPGEKAKRRNIRTHTYDCEMCPEITKGLECKLGSTCPHSHNVFESWLHPQKYRTMMCKDRDKCSRSVCFFAHGPHELRTPTIGTTSQLQQQQQQHLQQQQQQFQQQQQQFQQQQQQFQQQQQQFQQQPQLAGFAQQGRAPSDAAAAVAAAGMAVAADSMQSATTAAAGAPAGLQQQWQLMQGLAHLARAASCGSGNLMNAATSANAVNPAPGAVSPHAAAPQAAAHSTPPGPGASALAAGLAFNNSMAAQLQTAGGSVGSSDMASVQQLLSSLVNEVNISRQEAQHSRDVAAQAHQQLRALTAALASPESGGQQQQQQQQQAVVSQAAGFPAAGASGGLLQGDVTMLPLVSGAFLECSEASSASMMELSAMDCTPASSSNLSELTSGMFAGLQDASSSMYAAGGSGSGPLPQVLYGQAQAMSHASSTGAAHRMAGWAAAGSQARGGPMQASTDANAAAAAAAAYACALPNMQLMGGSPSALQRQQQQQAAMLAAAGLSAGAACVPSGSRTDLNTSAGDWLGRMPSGYFDMQR